jgi:hypothetical protein
VIAVSTPSVQGLGHAVIVDGYVAYHQVLSSQDHEALALEQPPGELAGLGEQAGDPLLAGRCLGPGAQALTWAGG